MLPLSDELMREKRSIIQAINDQRKNSAQVGQARHRSLSGFRVNLLSRLIAYTHQPKKPDIKWWANEIEAEAS